MDEGNGGAGGRQVTITFECGHEGGGFADTSWVGTPRLCARCGKPRIVTRIIVRRGRRSA